MAKGSNIRQFVTLFSGDCLTKNSQANKVARQQVDTLADCSILRVMQEWLSY